MISISSSWWFKQNNVYEKTQNSRRHCLLFHGIIEEKDEYNDITIISKVKKEMDIEILPNNLDPFHCIANPKTKKNERMIIIKFLQYNLTHVLTQE